jgi:ABC-2 type transport system permease protein
MSGVLRLYAGHLRAELAAAAAYRLQLVLGVLGWVYPLAFLALWRGAAQGEPVAGIEPEALAAYFCLVLVTNTLQITMPIVFGFGHQVYSGQLSALLLHPRHPLHASVAKALAENVYQLPILAVLVPGVLLLTAGTLTTDAATWGIAVLVMILGAVASIHLAAMSAAVAFWMSKAQGVQGLVVAAEWVLGGVIAPAVLLPGRLAEVAVHQPLWFAIGAGPAMLSGITEPSLTQVGEAAVWCVALHLAYRALWRRAVRRYEAVGS